MTESTVSALSHKGMTALRTLLTSGNSVATFLRGAGGTLGIQVASAALLFISQAVFARLMGVESYGIYVLAFAWMQLLLLAGRQGFDLATVRFVSDYKNRREWGLLKGYLSFSRTVTIFSSLGVAMGMALGAWYFRDRLGEEGLWAFWFAAAALPIFAFLQIHEATIRGLSFVIRPQFFMPILHPIMLVIGLSAAFFLWDIKPTAEIGMAVYLVATAIILIGLWIVLRPLIPPSTRDAASVADRRNWFNASMAMMFLMSFGPILNQMSIIILGALDGNAAAGEFSAAVRVSYIIKPLMVAQNVALGHMVARLYMDDNPDKLQRITSLSVRLVSIAALVVSLIVIVFGKWILGLLGDDFVSAYPVLVVLVCGNLLFAVAGPASMLLNMTGHHALSAKALGISAVFNLVMAFALIPYYGALGAAVASGLTLVLWGGLMAHATWRHLDIISVFTIPWRRPSSV